MATTAPHNGDVNTLLVAPTIWLQLQLQPQLNGEVNTLLFLPTTLLQLQPTATVGNYMQQAYISSACHAASLRLISMSCSKPTSHQHVMQQAYISSACHAASLHLISMSCSKPTPHQACHRMQTSCLPASLVARLPARQSFGGPARPPPPLPTHYPHPIDHKLHPCLAEQQERLPAYLHGLQQ